MVKSSGAIQLKIDTILRKIFSSLLFGSTKLHGVLQMKTVKCTTNISVYFSRKAAIISLRQRSSVHHIAHELFLM
jgi:hypothetical protein